MPLSSRGGPETVVALNEITICAVYDEDLCLKEVVVEPRGLAATIWDEGVSFSSDSAGCSPEDQARDEAEGMADEVEDQTGQRPIIREL